MSFITKSVLIDESKLPPNSSYLESRDNSKTIVLHNETFQQFCDRIVTIRSQKGYPPFMPNDLRELVLESLYTTTPPPQRSLYFKHEAFLPTFGQAISLAKTLVAQVAQNQAPFDVREKRAVKCNKCPLHLTKSMSPMLNAVVSRAINAVSANYEDLSKLESSELQKTVGACGVCGCALTNKLKVNTLSAITSLTAPQIEKITRVFGKKAFGDDGCWMLGECLTNVNLKTILNTKLRATANRSDLILEEYLSDKLQEAKDGQT